MRYSYEMTHRPTPLERAFELARSGACETISDIQRQLRSEGLDPHQIQGKSLRNQLRELLKAAAQPNT